MMKDPHCAYCVEGHLVDAFAIKIGETATAKVYLFREQSHEGRVIVAHKSHVSEIVDLSDADRDAYFRDLTRVAEAIHGVFSPAKVNYGAYGDTGGHLHFHLVPKYRDGAEWGGIFAMNPEKIYLDEDEYGAVIERLSEHLGIENLARISR